MKQLFLLILSILSVYPSLASNSAKWITSADCRNTVNTWICFQKDLHLQDKPHKANARIAADSKYWLWINGKLAVLEGGVKRGPNPQDTYYDSVDLTSYLKKGRNIISVLVWYYGKEGFSYKMSGKAGLFMDCTFDDGKQLVSDGSWRAILHPAFSTSSGMEPNFRLPESNICFDARKDIPKWEMKVQSSWPRAVEIGREGSAPWNRLMPRVIPQWKDFGLRNYVATKLHAGKNMDTLVCRLPYDAQVMPWFKVEASSDSRIQIFTDTYTIGKDIEHSVRAEYVTCEGVQSYENKGWMSGNIVYYVYPKTVKIKHVQYRETGYDTEFAGSFSCSDKFCNRLWHKAQRTLYINMRDTYFDCPDRERAQWAGDAVLESGQAFYALSPSSHLLMKKGLYEVMGWQSDDGSIFAPVPAGNWAKELPGQMLSFVGYYGLWNYYMNTGDIGTLRDLYTCVQRYLESWQLSTDGTMLARKGGWYWGDWGNNIDKVALFNAFYYLALKGQFNAALALGYRHDADRLSEQMSSLKESFNRVFWTGKGYRHPDYKEETDDRVQALAIVAGLAEEDKYPAILNIFKTIEHASPYMEKYVIEALFKMGQGRFGMERMRRRYNRMVNDPMHTTLYEGWNFSDDGSCNHAWSGGGLIILSGMVCGVTPIEPGYGKWQVAPQPVDINSAMTVVPTIKGLLKVSFHISGNVLSLTVKAPKGTSGQIVVPQGYEGENHVIPVKGSGKWTFYKHSH